MGLADENSYDALRQQLAAHARGDETLHAAMDPAFDNTAQRMTPLHGGLIDSFMEDIPEPEYTFNGMDLDSVFDNADTDTPPKGESSDDIFGGTATIEPPSSTSAAAVTVPSKPATPVDVEDEDPFLQGYSDDPQIRMQELSEDLESESAFKIPKALRWIILAVGALVIAGVFFFFIGRKAQTAKPEEPTLVVDPTAPTKENLHPTAIRTNNQTFKFSDTVYEDSLQITKFIELEKSVVRCYFMGKLAAYKQPVIFEVPAAVYNAHTEGDIVSINFNITKFSDTQYLTNIAVKEE